MLERAHEDVHEQLETHGIVRILDGGELAQEEHLGVEERTRRQLPVVREPELDALAEELAELRGGRLGAVREQAQQARRVVLYRAARRAEVVLEELGDEPVAEQRVAHRRNLGGDPLEELQALRHKGGRTVVPTVHGRRAGGLLLLLAEIDEHRRTALSSTATLGDLVAAHVAEELGARRVQRLRALLERLVCRLALLAVERRHDGDLAVDPKRGRAGQ